MASIVTFLFKICSYKYSWSGEEHAVKVWASLLKPFGQKSILKIQEKDHDIVEKMTLYLDQPNRQWSVNYLKIIWYYMQLPQKCA